MSVMDERRKRWKETDHKIKRAAQKAVQFCVRKGWMIRPSQCSRCRSTYLIDAHHADYSKPLDVEWLCKKCHRGEHGWMGSSNRRG